jgi:TatD DNase family protein
MKLIDTHTHLYDEQLAADRDEMIQRAIDVGVAKMYMPNCDSTTIDSMLAIEEKWKSHCHSMMGLHPCYVKENVEEELRIVDDWLSKRKFWGVGEIGLDKYWDVTFLEQQKMAFRYQIDLALKHDLPIIIHSREANQDCIEIVKEKQQGNLRGIFHCYSGSYEQAKEIIGLGFHLGIGGVITFKNTKLTDTIALLGLDNMVLETDAPYLAPAPYRGKRNESSYTALVAQKIADTLQLPMEEVARKTTENAEKIFR